MNRNLRPFKSLFRTNISTILPRHSRFPSQIQVRTMFTQPEILTKISNYGDLKSLGLSNFTPPGFAERILEAIYINTNLPWFATIIAATVLIRVVCFPVIIKVQRASALLQNLKPKSDPLTAEIKKLREDGDIPMATQKTRELQALFKENNVSPLTPILGLVQMPMFVSFFFAIRNMASLPVPGLENGGLLWFTDLTVADPFYILPTIAGAGFIMVMQAGSDMGGADNQQMAVMKPLMIGVAVCTIPFTSYFPAAVFMYWITSNLFTLLQVKLFKNEIARDYFGVARITTGVAQVTSSAYKRVSYAEAARTVFDERWKRRLSSKRKMMIKQSS